MTTETMTRPIVTAQPVRTACLVCAGDPASTAPVVGNCVHCGASVCLDHAHIFPVPAQPVGLLPAPAGARRIVCDVCARTITT